MADKMMKIAGRGDNGLAKAIKTDNEGHIVTKLATRKVIETVINAVSIPAGGRTELVDLGITNETEIWVWINIDVQPWSLQTSSISSTATTIAAIDAPVFPKINNRAVSHPDFFFPAVTFMFGQVVSGATGLTPPNSLAEAKQFTVLLPGLGARVQNLSATTATITVRVLRIFGR